MPSTSKSQQRLFCMAYAVRKGELERSKVTKSVLDIADGDMTDKEIKDFMELKENLIKSYNEFLTESFSLPKMKYVEENNSRYEKSYEIFSDDRKNNITCKTEQQFDLYYYEFDSEYDHVTENSDEPFNSRHFAIFALNFIGRCNRANKAAGRDISYSKAADELKKLK